MQSGLFEGLREGFLTGLQKGVVNGLFNGLFSQNELSKENVFLGIVNGNWNTAFNWSLRYVPFTNQSVRIKANCTVNTSPTVRNLRVDYGVTLTTDLTNRTITVNGELRSFGSINLSNAINNLVLNGTVNFINGTFTPGAGSTVTYSRAGDQNIINIAYRNLAISGAGVKYLISNVNVLGNASGTTTVRCDTNGFDLTVNGTCSQFNVVCSLAGNITFIGAISLGGGTFGINITGNPTIEIRGGFNINNASNSNFGTGSVRFTTNNQSLTGNNTISMTTVSIENVTVTSSMNGSFRSVSMNGTTVGSTFNNNGVFFQLSSTVPMSVGVFNYKNAVGSAIAYAFNGNYILPYTSYEGLQTLGTGTKEFSGDTVVNGNLITSGGSLDYKTFNVTVNGTSTVINNTVSFIKTSSTGTVIFKGLLSVITGGNINFPSGYAIELQGGFTFTNGSSTNPLYLKFTTNNQSLNNGSVINSINTILVSGSITLTNNSANGFTISSLDGDNTNSVFDNRGLLTYTGAAQPMNTGKFYTDQAANTVIYDTGNQTIRVPDDPSTPGNYRNLTLTGNPSTKTVGDAGTVNVRGTRTINAGVTVVGTITNNP